jgi:hypothetical protein
MYLNACERMLIEPPEEASHLLCTRISAVASAGNPHRVALLAPPAIRVMTFMDDVEVFRVISWPCGAC